MSNTANTFPSIKDYKPTQERIQSHLEHEEKRKADCAALAIKMKDKWDNKKAKK